MKFKAIIFGVVFGMILLVLKFNVHWMCPKSPKWYMWGESDPFYRLLYDGEGNKREFAKYVFVGIWIIILTHKWFLMLFDNLNNLWSHHLFWGYISGAYDLAYHGSFEEYMIFWWMWTYLIIHRPAADLTM